MRRNLKPRERSDITSFMKINKTKTTRRDFTVTKAQDALIFDHDEVEFPSLEELQELAQEPQQEVLNVPQGPSLETLIPEFTIGIDLGDQRHRVCVLNQFGQIIEEIFIDNDPFALLALAKKYPNARFVMEVGTHSPWISSLLGSHNYQVIVANARKLKAIYANERKCDELDARILSKIGRMDVSLLYPVQHVSQDALKDRLIISSRENLVNERKRLIQSIRGSVKSLGIRIPAGTASTIPKVVRITLADEPDVLASLEPTLKVIEQLNDSIRELDNKIETISIEKYPATEILRQVSGVGPITALAFVLAIEDPNRIDVTRNVGAYLGLVPGRDQSGEIDKQLGISKTGNPYVRKLLVQCAQYIMGAHGVDCDLRRAGLRKAEQGKDKNKKGAKEAKKKAIVAVARKLSVLLLSLWKSGEEYEPLRNATQA